MMVTANLVLTACGPLLLLCLGLIPDKWANAHVRQMRTLSMMFATTAFALGLAVTASVAWLGPIDWKLFGGNSPIPFSLGVYVDHLATVMLLLISFVGMIIVRFSSKYLDGEAAQGRFFRWICFTIGAALTLVISRNLVMFTAAWMMTSLGLHKLLTHYPERDWAIWTARKKFLISRLGDLLLLAALGMTILSFGTTDYRDLFAIAEVRNAPASVSWSISLIGLFFVLGAMTKSAQFPFHTWLPDTMEAPTPVSALMHAGIINAGGFLVIRLSPLISLSEVAVDLLKVVGLVTAIFGSLVMLTQTSVKRTLAYSTIAQMGFMMLQCGFGAYSAATLHIVAHACYKAYAFLMSGSQPEVIQSAGERRSPFAQVLALLVAILIAVGLTVGLLSSLIYGDMARPQAIVLVLIPTVAMTQLIWCGISTGLIRLATKSVLTAAALMTVYAAAYRVMDWVIADAVPSHRDSASIFDFTLIAVSFVGFGGLLILPALVNSSARAAWLSRFYVHAMNGFYVDIPARQLTARFWGRMTPVP